MKSADSSKEPFIRESAGVIPFDDEISFSEYFLRGVEEPLASGVDSVDRLARLSRRRARLLGYSDGGTFPCFGEEDLPI